MACTVEEDRIHKKEIYKEAKRVTKKAVTEAKGHTYEDSYQNLILMRRKSIFVSWKKPQVYVKARLRDSEVHQNKVASVFFPTAQRD